MLLTWKIGIILIMSTHTTKAASLICYNGSITNSKELSLKESPNFMDTVYISVGCKLIIVTHGYSSEIDNLILEIIERSIAKFGNTKCYCALNWKEAAAGYIGPITDPIKKILGVSIIGVDYPIASIAAGVVVAKEFSDALVAMKSRGLNLGDLYLIGHSEGAHLVGNAARYLQKAGNLIARITGLDPASIPIEESLKKGAAKLVDCVHTNAKGFGTNKAVCDIDFWVNYGSNVQPGCKRHVIDIVPFINPDTCSHQRAVLFEADAIEDPYSLQGRQASSYEAWKELSGTPDPDEINYIGFKIKPNITGSFYLCTNAEPKFGKGPEGMGPASCSCL